MRILVVAGAFLHAAHAQAPAGNGRQGAANPSSRELTVPQGNPGFTLLLPESTGVQFTNMVDELSSAANRTLENGAGVAIGDYDLDGRPDIFLCSLNGISALFQNLGDWRFRNATADSGLACAMQARGAVFADINADTWPDLLVTSLFTGVRCFTNNRAGKFVDHSRAAGIVSVPGGTTLALADVDGNGTLDLYIATYRADDIRDRARVDIQRVGGKISVAPALRDRVVLTESGLLEFGEPDLLFLNDGKGQFTEAPPQSGRFLDDNGAILNVPPRDWGLAASFRDLNSDGWPDLYVCNDYWTPDRLWLNRTAGIFQPVSALAIRHTSENSMGVDFADINGDGLLDFLVTDMLSRDPARRQRQATAQTSRSSVAGEVTNRPQYMQNMLFLNRGDGTFAEISEFAGVSASEWSWQPVFIDIDLDGLPDLLIPAGHTRDVQDLDATAKIRALQHAWPGDMGANEMQTKFTHEMMEHARLYPDYKAPIVTFRNNGNLTFQDMTAQWGTDQQAVHQGIALADLDGDGDLDFVVNNLNSPAAVYRNNAPAARILVRLHGLSPNTDAIGAKVTLSGDDVAQHTQEVASGGRYLSGFDTALVFAARTNGMRLQVRWPNGKASSLDAVKPNRSYFLQQSH